MNFKFWFVFSSGKVYQNKFWCYWVYCWGQHWNMYPFFNNCYDKLCSNLKSTMIAWLKYFREYLSEGGLLSKKRRGHLDRKELHFKFSFTWYNYELWEGSSTVPFSPIFISYGPPSVLQVIQLWQRFFWAGGLDLAPLLVLASV